MANSPISPEAMNTSGDCRTEDLGDLSSWNGGSSRTAIMTDDMASIGHPGTVSRSSLILNDASKTGIHHDEIEGTQSSYRSLLWRSWACCSFQNFCYCVQLVNCILVCLLIALAMEEYPKIEALEAELEDEEAEMESLQEEVREKQQGQIQELNQQVADEQQFNFLTLAGTFTLITCLISMFQMSMHLQKMNQPKIQRKIIAMLWMSPIYSVTSFLTLWFPSVGGWMAIIKDFYEAYCIYTFLSFLIAVLGHGDRDQAVDVLARHAPNLERPTRCLGCFYEPQPEVSDHAKANAVLTQCQIYCLQFTFLRPITTIIYVLMNHGKEDTVSESQQETTFEAEDDYETEDMDREKTNNTTGTRAMRWLQQNNGSNQTTIDNDERDDEAGSSTTVPSPTTHAESSTTVPAPSPVVGSSTTAPSHTTTAGSSTTTPPTIDVESSPIAPPSAAVPPSLPAAPSAVTESFATLAPSIVSGIVGSVVPTLAPVAGAIAGSFTNTTEGVGDDQLADTVQDQDSSTDDLVESTVAYFQSPAFVLAMVVNVSVVIAFTGLLKFYHAVRDDLKWCRPWPKFLTIKGVVFVTFWQGLMILIFVVVMADPEEKEDATARALQYQNILICIEMLFFAITQWVRMACKREVVVRLCLRIVFAHCCLGPVRSKKCVFPADEWEDGYQPKEMLSPGLGIKDFVSDVGHIVQNRSGRSRKGRRKITRRKANIAPDIGMGSGASQSDFAGLYHPPGTASAVSSQYGNISGLNRDSYDDDDDSNNVSVDDSDDGHHNTPIDLPTSNQKNSVRFGDLPTATISPVRGRKNDGTLNDSMSSKESFYDGRNRTLSDGTAGNKADDELDSDLELL